MKKIVLFSLLLLCSSAFSTGLAPVLSFNTTIEKDNTAVLASDLVQGDTYTVSITISNNNSIPLYFDGLINVTLPQGFTVQSSCEGNKIVPAADTICTLTGTYTPTSTGTFNWTTQLAAYGYVWKHRWTMLQTTVTGSPSPGPGPGPGPQPSPTGLMFSPYIDITGYAPGGAPAINVWDSASNSMQPNNLEPVIVASKVNSIHLAFVSNKNGATCTPTWAGYDVPAGPTYAAADYGVDVINKIRTTDHVNVVVSFGGQQGTYLEQSCANASDLAAAYEKVIAAYQPSEINFDYENGFEANVAGLDMAMDALNQVRQTHPNLPISFTLAVLPTGLTNAVPVIQEAMKYLQPTGDFSVDLMAMDYGSAFDNQSMGQNAIDAANAVRAELDAIGGTDVKIGLIPMIGLNDTVPSNFSLSDVDTVMTFAKATSWMNLVSMWSLGRDAPCTGASAQATCSSTNPTTGQPNQSTNYDYTARFLQDL